MTTRKGSLGVLLLLICLFAGHPAALRLEGDVHPTHYELGFDVDLARGLFQGREAIRVQTSRPTNRIVLNAAKLTIEEANVAAGRNRQKARVELDAEAETVTLTLPRAIPAGEAIIDSRFFGALRTDLRGLYLSQSRGRNYAVTQFESTDARRAFPSFDEPSLKATFDVSVTIDRGDTAISNGRIVADTPGPGDGRHTLKFATTPKMSSYLLALAIGDFECLEDSAEGVPLRVCTVPGKKALGRIALDWARDILGFYNRYYSIKYPFGKLDMVAIPDFAAGAMENTAAIFYREEDLLAESGRASVLAEKNIASIVAHEMAHQWFGNLVTMRWWDDLWLNEGFATWMANRPLAALRPEWNVAVDEAAETRRALTLDVLRTTRAIHASVETPDEIEASFDAIAYEKGAAVLRMIEHYVGPDLFRRGINAYLEKYAYSNATSEDFWTIVAATTGKPVDRVLPTFVNQSGAPIVDVALDCASGSTRLSLGQRRLTAAASSSAGAETLPSAWQIPLCVKTPGSAGESCQVMDRPSATLTLDGGCRSWAFVNGSAQGYFRTAYSPALIRSLAPDIGTALTPAERSTLADDEWSLVLGGRHDVSDYLTLVGGMAGETVAGVFGQITTTLFSIDDSIVTDAMRPAYASWVRKVFGPRFAELGMEAATGETDDRRVLRAAMITLLGTTGDDPAVQAAARTALNASLATGTDVRPLDPTSAESIVRVAAQRGDAALFDRLAAAYSRATTPAERNRYMYALTAFEDPALVRRAVERVVSPDLRSQDAANYIARLLRTTSSREQAWEFLKTRWEDLRPRLGIAFAQVRIAEAVGTFCTARERDDVRGFFATHRMPSATRAIEQSVEQIDACIALREKQAPVLGAWLNQQ